LTRYLAKNRADRTPPEMKWVMKMMDKYECIEYGKKSAKNLAGAALKEFYTVFGDRQDTIDRQFIENMILYIVKRDY